MALGQRARLMADSARHCRGNSAKWHQNPRCCFVSNCALIANRSMLAGWNVHTPGQARPRHATPRRESERASERAKRISGRARAGRNLGLVMKWFRNECARYLIVTPIVLNAVQLAASVRELFRTILANDERIFIRSNCLSFRTPCSAIWRARESNDDGAVVLIEKTFLCLVCTRIKFVFFWMLDKHNISIRDALKSRKVEKL